jgi:hypothetical protein
MRHDRYLALGSQRSLLQGGLQESGNSLPVRFACAGEHRLEQRGAAAMIWDAVRSPLGVAHKAIARAWLPILSRSEPAAALLVLGDGPDAARRALAVFCGRQTYDELQRCQNRRGSQRRGFFRINSPNGEEIPGGV